MYKSQYGVPSQSPSIFSRMSGGGKRGPTPARHPSAVHVSFGILCQHGYAKWLSMVFFLRVLALALTNELRPFLRATTPSVTRRQPMIINRRTFS